MTDASTPTGGEQRSLSPFQSFALSLGSSAMIYLGEIPDPESKAPRPNLMLAKATIETLEMLAEKTTGNLSPEEDKTLAGLLSELRLRFVAAKQQF